jgi:hypothetical protein
MGNHRAIRSEEWAANAGRSGRGRVGPGAGVVRERGRRWAYGRVRAWAGYGNLACGR